jgi:hypothetical protein
MKADQINRFVLTLLLVITVFLLLDSYLLPLDTSRGVLVTKTGQETSMLRVAINGKQTQWTITVPLRTYNNIEVNDTIEVGRSFITHRILKIGVPAKGKEYSWHIGFVFLGGYDFLTFLIVTISVYLFFFYNKVKRAETKREITIYLGCLCALFILLYYLFQ